MIRLEIMARKTKEDAQKSRDQILDAAEHVFYRIGFTLATMADIAEAAQLSRGAVYGHYKGKLEVATAMAERRSCAECAGKPETLLLAGSPQLYRTQLYPARAVFFVCWY